MKIPSELFTRLRAVFTKPALDADFNAELEQHLDAAAADNIRSGMTPDEARRRARIALGGIEQTRELHRDARGLPWLEDLARDVRLAARMLRRSPGFTIVAGATLALGIGANTAIFSVFYGVLLRPLPYPEQQRLVFIHDWAKDTPFDPVSYLNFVAWRKQQQSFTAIGVARPWQFSYVGPNETERLNGAVASYDLFAAIGLAPIRGRLFTAEDDKSGAERTVVLRASLWKRLFGGRDSVIGEKIKLSGEFHTVVGVLPDDFRVPLEGAELWTPIGQSLTGEELQYGYRPGGMYAYARLKPGVSLESAAANLRALAAGLDTEHPSGGLIPTLLPLATAGAGEVRPLLYVLLGAAGFVLLIACANVANLQLARARARSREFAVRAALGAGRGRVVRQLLVESLILGLLGCGAGALLGSWALGGLKAMLPAGTSRMDEVSLNLWVLGFAVVASLLTSVLFGLVPASHAARQNVREALAQEGRSAGSTRGNRWRAGLIIGECALTCALLVGAGLMIRTLGNLYRSDPGFATAHLLTFNWVVRGGRYENPAVRYHLINRALERLAAVPGVAHVGIVDPLPFEGRDNRTVYLIKGGAMPGEGGPWPSAGFGTVGGDWLGALGVKLIAGRAFDARDDWQSTRVVMVDTQFAEKEFRGRNPIGQHIWTGGTPPERESDWMEIIGVVDHINTLGPGQPSLPQIYWPTQQTIPQSMGFVVRAEREPTVIVSSLRAALREVADDLSMAHVRTMDQLFASNIANQRLVVKLLGAFAALALLLAGVGLYGVVSYSVSQRTREIGIRIALGATSRSVVHMTMQQGAKLASAGLVIGLAAALALTRLLQSLLFETSPHDPLIYGVVAVGLLGVAALACWLPARRAAKVNPIVALRAE
jgi:putative ABC transport system permease protein